MQSIGETWRTLAVVARVERTGCGSVGRATADEAVKAAVASGQSARVIMQFATTAERDAAFNRLLDRGAAVRAVDTEGGPALVVFGSAASFGSEIPARTQVSLDAGVRVLGRHSPARDTSARKPTASADAPSTISASRNGIAVAIIDSGIAPHADLPLSRIRAYKDFVSGGRTPVDNCGHGTHVAGIVAGSGAQLERRSMPASRPTSTSWRCACSATTAPATPAT